MRILILDDLEERHRIYQSIYNGHDVTSVNTYSAFVDALQDSPWDLIHLDHDLGDFVTSPDTWVDGWGSTREYTGLEAATRVCELDPELRPARVVVHSINPVGARNMMQTLTRAGIDAIWEPFGESQA